MKIKGFLAAVVLFAACFAVNVFASGITTSAESKDLRWAAEKFAENSFEPDVIYPISHVAVAYIGDVGECEFLFHGFYGRETPDEKYAYTYNYNMIYSVEISSVDGSFHQVLDGFTTLFEPYMPDYGIVFSDFNNDGNLDLQLHLYSGGTMRNEPSLFWLWNSSEQLYVKNAELEEISGYAMVAMTETGDLGEKQLYSYTRISAVEYVTVYYAYYEGELIAYEMEEVAFEETDGETYMTSIISRLVDGEMKVVEENREKYEQDN